jgi:hypothetical protein
MTLPLFATDMGVLKRKSIQYQRTHAALVASCLKKKQKVRLRWPIKAKGPPNPQ